MENTESPKSFLSSLFDFSFRRFITTRLVQVLYVLSMVGLALFVLSWVGTAFKISNVMGLLTLLVLAPIAFLIGVIYVRVVLELMIVIFRISEDTAAIAGAKRGDRTPRPGPAGREPGSMDPQS